MKRLFLFLAFFTLLTGMVYADDLSTGKGSSAYGDYYSTNYPSNAWGNTNSTATLWATNNAAATERNNSIDLNGTYTYSVTNAIWRGYDGSSTYGYATMRIYYSNDNSTWTLAQAITGNTQGQRQFNFSTVNARYWRFGGTAPYGDGIYGYTSGIFIYGTIVTTAGVLINSPLSGNTYQQNSTLANFTVSSSTNTTSMMVYKQVNSGTISLLGYYANGSTNTATISTSQGSNNLTLIIYDGSTNTSASSIYTQEGGLTFTVSNKTTGETLSASVQAGNATNYTVQTSSSSANASFNRGTIPELVNATAYKTGYANTTLENIVVSNTSSYWYNLTLWRLQEFKAVDSVSNATLSSFTITISSGSNSSSYATTNGTYQLSLGSIPSGSFVVTYAATGYNTTNFTFNANSTSEINYTAQLVKSGLIIYYYDEASCASTCRAIYASWSVTNGTSTNNSYSTYPSTYANLSYLDLPIGTDTFTFNNTLNGTYYPRQYIVSVSSSLAQTLNVYLLNSTAFTIAATYCAVNTGNTGISGASFTFGRLIGSSYVTVAQGTAGSDGCYTVYLDSLTTYQAIVSATGYNTGTFTTQPKTLQTVTLTSASATLGFQISYADDADQVLARLLPQTNALTSYAQIINFTIYSYNGTLTNWGLQCDYNGSTIYAVNVTTSPSGGSTTTNVSLTNKTNPTNFYCYGLFDRTGYNTTYLNRTYYIFSPNATYANTSASGLVGQINNGQFSTETLFIASIVLTTVGTAGLTSAAAGVGAPLGAGIISLALLTGFAFLGWINAGWVILYAVVTLAFSYFNSRQF